MLLFEIIPKILNILDIPTSQAQICILIIYIFSFFQRQVCLRVKGKRVLEVGCSDGPYAIRYAQTAASVDGVDISDVGIELARGRGINNAECQVCDAHQLPFEDESFDCVIVNSLLHHLDLETGLMEIHRVLKPRRALG